MKKYLLMLCCAAMCAGFVGCSDDDNEGGDVDVDVDVSVESLVGRWCVYQEEDWDEEENKMIMDDEFGEGVDLTIFEFNADGTGGSFGGSYLSELEDENNWQRFTYTLKGTQVIMYDSDGYLDDFGVLKITSSELVIAWYMEDGETGEKYIGAKSYYRRMK